MTARLEYVAGVVGLAIAALALSTLYLRLLARRRARDAESRLDAVRSALP